MTQYPEGFEGFLGGGYLEVTDKLRECGFFVGLMKGTTDWEQFRWLTSACFNAARAAIDWLALGAFYAIPGEEQWSLERDDGAIATLGKYILMEQNKKTGKVFAAPIHPLLKTLCAHRKVAAHEGPLWIWPEQVKHPNEFRLAGDDIGVLQFAEDVLALLVRIQQELRPDLA